MNTPIISQPQFHYHNDGTLPVSRNLHTILVFGSNLAGRHGAGAALVAAEQFGALRRHGSGLSGRSYAIATKDENLVPRDLRDVVADIHLFCRFTYDRQDLRFWVTAVGCGLAGFKDEEIAPHFATAINCSFPKQWLPYLV